MANAFVPIKPISDKSSGYQNFLNFLQAANAFSNPADSIMYRWKDNPSIDVNYINQGPVNTQAGTLKTTPKELMGSDPRFSALSKAEPYINNINIENNPIMHADGSFRMHRNKPAAMVDVKTGISVPMSRNVISDEVLGHGISDFRPSYQNKKITGKQHPDFYDNKTGKLMSYSEFDSSPDYYDRASQEIMAESNIHNDKNISTRSNNYGNKVDAVATAEQVHPVYKGFMQNLSKLDGKTVSALGAVTSPLQVIQGKDLYDKIKSKGTSAGYADWLGLNTEYNRYE